MAVWEFGGFAPTFNGPDFGTFTVLENATWSLDIGTLFTLDFGTPSYSHISPSLGGTGITFHSATGIYTGAGTVTPATYTMTFRCSGSDTPPSYTDYQFIIQVNAVVTGIPPAFTGHIDDQIGSGSFTFDVSTFATGEISYAITPVVAGITISAAGIVSVDASTTASGLFGPFTVVYTNATGDTSSNTFLITVIISAGAPVFVGPDFSPLSILETDSGSRNVGALFTVPSGTMTFTDVGATVVGVTFLAGVYTYVAPVTVGNYAMRTRASNTDIPPLTTDYSWTFNVQDVVVDEAPIFTGVIPDQNQSVDFTLATSGFATGQTSYAISALPPGMTFNTATGLLTVVYGTVGLGVFGPFFVTYSNATGDTDSNLFLVTLIPPSGGGGDFSDTTLQQLLDPGNNFNGIRIIIRNSPTDMTKVNYYVVPHMTNRGQSRWVEVLATDTAQVRAQKIIDATTIPAQPIWPLPTP